MRVETILVSDQSDRADDLGRALIADLRDATRAYACLSGTAVPDFAPDVQRADSAVIVLDAGQEPILADVCIAYFIVCSDRSDVQPSEVDACAAELRGACSEHGCTWGGMVFLGDAAELSRHFGTARMGTWRRHTSEGIDRLIAALRVGTSIEECQLLAGAGTPIDPESVIDVRRPFPRWIPRILIGPKGR